MYISFDGQEPYPQAPVEKNIGGEWLLVQSHSGKNLFREHEKNVKSCHADTQQKARALLQRISSASPADIKHSMIELGFFESESAVVRWVNIGNTDRYMRSENDILAFIDGCRDALAEKISLLSTGVAKTGREANALHREMSIIDMNNAISQQTPPSRVQSVDSSRQHTQEEEDEQSAR